jgi:hypothetical protein
MSLEYHAFSDRGTSTINPRFLIILSLASLQYKERSRPDDSEERNGRVCPDKDGRKRCRTGK